MLFIIYPSHSTPAVTVTCGAGAVQRICIYDYNATVAGARGQGGRSGGGGSANSGPVTEIQTRSKLTCLCYSRQQKQLLLARWAGAVVCTGARL